MKKYIVSTIFILCFAQFLAAQSSINNPISLYPFFGPSSYKNTINTSSYSNSYGGSQNDVYYKFIITTSMDVTISTCGSEITETQLYLLNNKKTQIAQCGTYWGEDKCNSSGGDSKIKMNNLASGEYYIVVEGRKTNGIITLSILTGPQKYEIDLGTKDQSFAYTHTFDTNNSNNSYTGRPTNDIFYSFELTTEMDITVSHCGSGLSNTYVHLLNSSLNSIDYNDDYSGEGKCTNTLHSYLKKVLAPGKYYVVSEGYSQNGNITTKIEGVKKSTGIGSSDKTYIHTRTYKYQSNSEYIDEITYLDGFGRPIQSIQKGITPITKSDLITYQEYDLLGREGRSWLPSIASNNNGAYVDLSTFKSRSMDTYNNTTYNAFADSVPYKNSIYEISSLDRVKEEYYPGMHWHKNNKKTSNQFLANKGTTGNLSCVLFSVTGSGTGISLSKNGYYADYQLYVTETSDEDGNISYKFKNKLDQVVLTREINGTPHDTYYVYDDFGNLCYVLPPLATDTINKVGVKAELIELLGYFYKYDGRNRCVVKKLPGVDCIFYVYDKADQLILIQDGEQRKKKSGTKSEWTFNKYDAFGRLIISGIYKTAESHEQLAPKFGNVVFTEKTGNGGYGYTWDTLKQTDLEDANADVLIVNYYDDYETMLKTNPYYKANLDYNIESGYGIRHTSAKGLLVGTRVKLINSEGKSVNTIEGQIATAMYYDNRGRLIQTKSNNHLTGGIEKEYLAYNFTGQPTKKLHIHSATGKSNIKEEYAYTYDHAGRLLKTTHQLTEGTAVKPQVTLAENTYDELGRLKTSKANNQINLNKTYSYNIRSWISNITNAHFNETLTYSYNGNISRMQWGQAGKTRAYNFTYDNLSRLKSAVYSGDGNFSTAYSYDKHGNMLTLQRYGLTTETSADKQIDNLTMTYAGNQMINVTDAVADISLNTSMDFKDYTKGAGIEYVYNANGAMSKDLNKGISSITYNSLNLPQIIDIKNMNAEGRNEYTYSASGEKLRVVQKWNPGYNSEPIIGSDVNVSSLTMASSTDYVGNKVYEGNTLKRILVDGGYYEGGNYYFYIADHLGNNRIVANAAASVVQSTQYYPFGTSFADKIETSNQPYKYNGKELDSRNGLNMYDYSARYKDDFRFTSVDPLAEKYYNWSPYAYVGNNPLRRTDPTGMDWEDEKSKEYAEKLSADMSNRVSSLDKERQTVADNYAKALKSGNLEKADQLLAEGLGLRASIEDLERGITELTAMGDTKDQKFAFKKISGNEGSTGKRASGVIEMEVTGTSIAVHESAHGYDLWKGGGNTRSNFALREIKAYGRQFSYDKSSLPNSYWGGISNRSNITEGWVYGVYNEVGGVKNYLYADKLLENSREQYTSAAVERLLDQRRKNGFP